MAKIITVFGATGKQGGAVVRGLVKDANFKVRAVARDPNSAKAQALKALGAEIVAGDFFDPNSLKNALNGAYGCYLVTDFYKSMKKEDEIQQGKNVVDAAKEAGVKHLVFSGLEDVKEAIGIECAHFDSKATVERYIESHGVPHTMVRISFYLENLFEGAFFHKAGDTLYLAVPMPEVKLHVIPINEFGPCITAIFNQPERFLGKKIGLSAEKVSVDELATILTKHVTPLKFANPKMTTEAFSKLNFPLAVEFAAMYKFYNVCNPDRDPALTKELHPNMLNVEQWVEANKEKIHTVLTA